ncbi:MAG: SatD family protein [bacterium]
MTDRPPKYVAIIGDLVGSRAMAPDERNQVQKRFQVALDRVNVAFKDELAALFLITAGDETQGILHRPDCSYEILRQIQFELWPARIVFGVGYGPMTTPLKEYAVGADGPAFYRARQALEQARAERKAYGKSIRREVLFDSDESFKDEVVNALFLAISVLRGQWTQKQWQILRLVQQGATPSDISTSLAVPRSNISRTLHASYYREFERIVAALQSYLKHGIEER